MLKHLTDVPLPAHGSGGFDHADIHLESGRVFMAHTANGSVEVIDGENLRHERTIEGCPEASGVLCAQKEGLVFAAARGAGKILTIDAKSQRLLHKFQAGTKPNGLAWDSKRKHLLVADVSDENARILDSSNGHVLSTRKLQGRPRWCVYDAAGDRFLINIRDPATVEVLKADTLEQTAAIPVKTPGPHGLAIDEMGHAYVACDGKKLVVLDLTGRSEQKGIPIAGAPDVIWYNMKRQVVYCAAGDPGIVEVIDIRSNKIVERLETEADAHTFAFDQIKQRMYTLLPKSCRAGVYEEVP